MVVAQDTTNNLDIEVKRDRSLYIWVCGGVIC